nr:Mariner Mos1 transposase [Hymenolepis microstoma]
MSELKPNSRRLQEVLLFYFDMKISADWLRLTGLSQILIVKRLAISDKTCRAGMVLTFKVVSGDFAIEDRHSGGLWEKVVEDAELEASDS